MSVPIPFVLHKVYRTQKINNTPKKIFGGSIYTCIIDSIIMASNGDIPTKVGVYTRAVTAPETHINIDLFDSLQMNPPQVLEVIKDSILTMNPGDELYAFSDDSVKYFNCNVSYRELTELTEDIE
jgi:hypothetical protein